MMLTNTDITYYAYNNGQYDRFYIGPGNKVFWNETSASIYSKTGIINKDSAEVYVPLVTWPNEITDTPNKDFVIKGCCLLTIDTSTSQNLSTSLKAIRDVAKVVKAIEKNTFGSSALQHLVILAG